jgi:hypothetical protein
MGYTVWPRPGQQRTVSGLIGNDGRLDGARLAHLPHEQQGTHVTQPSRQVASDAGTEGVVVKVHLEPDRPLSEGAQAPGRDQFSGGVGEIELSTKPVDGGW